MNTYSPPASGISAATSAYEKVPASDRSPAATHTASTAEALPTLQVMTRDFRNTPVPIMLATFIAIAAVRPSARSSSGRAGAFAAMGRGS